MGLPLLENPRISNMLRIWARKQQFPALRWEGSMYFEKFLNPGSRYQFGIEPTPSDVSSNSGKHSQCFSDGCFAALAYSEKKRAAAVKVTRMEKGSGWLI